MVFCGLEMVLQDLDYTTASNKSFVTSKRHRTYTNLNDFQKSCVSVRLGFLWMTSGRSLSSLSVFKNLRMDTVKLVALSVYTDKERGNQLLVQTTDFVQQCHKVQLYTSMYKCSKVEGLNSTEVSI